MKCKVRNRQARTQPPSNYCKPHQKAYESLQKTFQVWKKTSNIEWKNYLQEVARNPLTGTWAREVAENTLSEEH